MCTCGVRRSNFMENAWGVVMMALAEPEEFSAFARVSARNDASREIGVSADVAIDT